MDSGAPFAKKGGSELALPSIDVPISLLEWELFLPEQYKVKDFGGDAIAAYLLPAPVVEGGDIVATGLFGPQTPVSGPDKQGIDNLVQIAPGIAPAQLLPGQIGGVVVDPQGAVIAGAQVTVTSIDRGYRRSAVTNSSGHWVVSNFPTGKIKIQVSSKYFKSAVQTNIAYDASQPSRHDFRLSVGEASTTVEVTSDTPLIETTQAQVTNTFSGTNQSTYAGVSENGRKDRDEKKAEQRAQNSPSANVFDLQKRVAGVLPVRVDVPRAGNSYRFARALVLDEETKVTFSYKTSAKR